MHTILHPRHCISHLHPVAFHRDSSVADTKTCTRPLSSIPSSYHAFSADVDTIVHIVSLLNGHTWIPPPSIQAGTAIKAPIPTLIRSPPLTMANILAIAISTCTIRRFAATSWYYWAALLISCVFWGTSDLSTLSWFWIFSNAFPTKVAASSTPYGISMMNRSKPHTKQPQYLLTVLSTTLNPVVVWNWCIYCSSHFTLATTYPTWDAFRSSYKE